MKRFRNYLSEEVIPTAQVSDGSVDIEKPAVRGQINATLTSVTAQPAVTPYVVLQRIAKALLYFHIVLPKRAYLEGDRGVEVIEVQQFGPRMGMTDQGEFVKEVPAKYFLFISYRVTNPVGVTYTAVDPALSSVGGMFKVTAKLVDELELQKLMATAEIALAEDAACRQNMAKMMAPKEPMKDVDSSTEGTEKAVSDSQRKKDKKLSADTLDETRMPASIIRRKQKLASMSPEEKAKKFAGKSEEELKSMARRHGYGKDSTEYSKHKKLDEGFAKIVKSVKRSLKGWPAQPLHGEGGNKPKDVVKRTRGRSDSDIKGLASDSNKTAEHSPAGLQKNVAKQEMKRRKLDEKAPPGDKFERMVKHIKKGYSKDGLTKKEKSIAYATAWKAKNKEK